MCAALHAEATWRARMRAEFARWVTTYPQNPIWRDGSFAESPAAQIVVNDVPNSIRRAFPNLPGITITGSAGKGDWTHTPWVALLDQAVTTTVEEGFYLVYLLSFGTDRLYIILGQGCTLLKDSIGIPGAREELHRRAALMRSRLIRQPAGRLQAIEMDLNSQSWRARLYEAGAVVGIEYATDELPPEDVLRADLRDALNAYRRISAGGGWLADDVIIAEALEDAGIEELEQAKRYRQHRSIERQAGHAKKVKKALGFKCMGCDVTLNARYGSTADGLIDAHHLVPLSSLADGEVTRLDPATDFAVLCPNCHRVIHRMPDPSDLAGLRNLVRPVAPA